MRINGFSCGFNTPPSLKGETTHGLPPYAKRVPFLVDEYPACPENWMRSEGKIKSYFVPVQEGNGMWLDFNSNDNHAYHLAIVVSVQGVNPITGLPCKDAQLEQYIEKCPRHKIKFGPDRYCKECDHKWPKQNYISTTGTPRGYLWLDGFKTAEGIVRQYILTSEKMKGVASNIIGEDRVFALGISFFLSKEKKPIQPSYPILRGAPLTQIYNISSSPQFFSPTHTPLNWDNSTGVSPIVPSSVCSNSTDTYSSKWQNRCSDYYDESSSGSGMDYVDEFRAKLSKKSKPGDSQIKTQGMTKSFAKSIIPVETKKLEVGAGAEISQLIHDDPNGLDFWKDSPEGILCINYCTEIDGKKIIEGGKININGHKEGFLQDVPVGN